MSKYCNLIKNFVINNLKKILFLFSEFINFFIKNLLTQAIVFIYDENASDICGL